MYDDKVVDETTEDVVLGAVIMNPESYNAVAQYVPDINVFTQGKARHLWVKIGKMIRADKLIDTVTMCASLSNDDISNGVSKGYIVDCTSSSCVGAYAEAYAQKLYEKFLLRKVVQEADNIKVTASTNNSDVYNTITNAHTLMGELLQVRPSEKFDIDDVVIETIKDMRQKKNKLIKTGYPKIDSFAGGLTRGEITIIGGRPGHGKTTFLINLLAKIVEGGYRCVLFNRELPNSEVIKKLICLEMPMLSYSMVRRGIFNDDSIDYLKKAKELITKKFNSDAFLMFDNIRDFSKTASEVKKFKPDVIIDDYIQLVSPSGREDQRRLQIEKLVNDYKWLAKESKCAVIMASQLNRMVEMRTNNKVREPQLSDLAESGAIEQIAENVFFVYYGHKLDPAKYSRSELSIIAGKVRYGQTGSVVLGYNGDVCTIYDELPLIGENTIDENKIPSF